MGELIFIGIMIGIDVVLWNIHPVLGIFGIAGTLAIVNLMYE